MRPDVSAAVLRLIGPEPLTRHERTMVAALLVVIGGLDSEGSHPALDAAMQIAIAALNGAD